jgi:protein TonB
MEPQEKLTTQQFIIDRLHDIQRKAETNKYADASTSIKEVKAADAKNLYLIAIEKQILKLNDGATTPENRTEIIKSLPSMIDRAISDLQRRALIPKVDEVQKEQKEAALEKLKSQYFQRADDYVEKQDYQRALEEIRRIYIIEPGSVVAKEYEQKIEQLANLQIRAESQTPQVAETEDAEQLAATADNLKEKVILEEEPKKSKLPLFVGAAVLLIILVIAIWFIFLRGSNNVQPTQATTEQPLPTQGSETPGQPTATPTPQPEKAASPVVETPRPAAKTPKTRPEVKPITVAAPVKTPKATPPERKQPTPQPAAAAVPPPAPEKPKETESAPVAVPFVAIQETPKVIRREPAAYPSVALKLGIEGRVVVEVTVDAQGRPIQANVMESTSDIFDESATDAAMKTTYKPAVMSTGPVTAKVRVIFDFQLKR